MSNIYAWLDIEPNKGGKMSSIRFIGEESLCVDFVRKATYERDIRPKIQHELKNGWYSWSKPTEMICTLTAGEGATRIERKFKVKITY